MSTDDHDQNTAERSRRAQAKARNQAAQMAQLKEDLAEAKAELAWSKTELAFYERAARTDLAIFALLGDELTHLRAAMHPSQPAALHTKHRWLRWLLR